MIFFNRVPCQRWVCKEENEVTEITQVERVETSSYKSPNTKSLERNLGTGSRQRDELHVLDLPNENQDRSYLSLSSTTRTSIQDSYVSDSMANFAAHTMDQYRDNYKIPLNEQVNKF